MLQFIISVFAFVLAISVLVVVHEFGHFWVARRAGIKVLRFSVGFGRPFYRWYDKLGTEYVLSIIPLGGYVALFGEREQAISGVDRHLTFHHKPVWVRMLVILAGPLFNLLFAVLAYFVTFLLGVTVLIPLLGNVPKDSIAGIAGLRAGQEIVSIDDRPVSSWETVSLNLLSELGNDKVVMLGVKDPKSQTITQLKLDLGNLSSEPADPQWLEEIGLIPFDPFPAIVGKVLEDLPAAKSGLLEGDEIIMADLRPISSRSSFIEYVQSHAKKTINIEVLREGKKVKLSVVPIEKHSKELQKEVGFIGVEFPAPKEFPKNLLRTQRYGVIEALKKAFSKTGEYTLLTIDVLKKMLTGNSLLNTSSLVVEFP